VLSAIDADNRDRDRIATACPKMSNLRVQVVYHPVNLPNHRLLDDLYFDAYFDCRDPASFDRMLGLGFRRNAGNDLSKRAIAAARLYAMRFILNV
jgi:hypothetical protein